MTTTIQSLPSLRTCRFGRRKEIHHPRSHCTSKANQVIRPATIDFDSNTSIAITNVRHRDWNFADDLETMNKTPSPSVKYRVIPSPNNTLKTQVSIHNDQNNHLYDDYDMDEQDFQWLINYNQYRLEKNLPELDENIFEYVMQCMEHQCLTVYRRKNYEDIIQCDACHRLDDVKDLIQCLQCNTVVHKTCYGVDVDEDAWKCLRCQENNSSIRCYLCYQTQGALKPMKILTDGEEEVWVHVSCAFWCPSIIFKTHNTPILSSKLSNDGSCSICYQTLGVKLLCSWKHCSCRFHARCAMNHGQDMLIVESDDRNSVRLLALCHRHTDKMDSSEIERRQKRAMEQQQQRFEQYATDIDLNLIKNETELHSDIVDSIHTYWLLKRQAKKSRPLIDLPTGSFDAVQDQRIDLKDFVRRYLCDHAEVAVVPPENFFVQFARRQRSALMDYDRNLFCLFDGDQKARLEPINTSLLTTKDF